MNKKLFMVMGLILFCTSNPANAEKIFAHSKSLNMSFKAIGDPWCNNNVTMEVTAVDANKFDTPAYLTILKKLGQVMNSECPAANTITITGLENGKTVWAGSAARNDGWQAKKNPVAMASSSNSIKPVSSKTEPVLPAITEKTESVLPVATKKTMPVLPALTEKIAPAADVADKVIIQASAQAMEIAGWKPTGLLSVVSGDMKLNEIISSEDGCAIRTLVGIKKEFKPTFKMNRQYDCVQGYVKSRDLTRSTTASLYYSGQAKPFDRISGFWFAGFNLRKGFPREIVNLYKVDNNEQRKTGQRTGVEKLMVWIGEDRQLRVHYFVVYNHYNKEWRVSNTPIVVLTDNDDVKNNPEKTDLAKSLAEVFKSFYGYKDTNSFSSVPFVIVNKLEKTPILDYFIARRDNNPNASFLKAGSAHKPRGIPWSLKVDLDFSAKREAYTLAEQKRIENERLKMIQRQEAEQKRIALQQEAEQKRLEQRQAAEQKRIDQMRAQKQLRLDEQFKVLSTVTKYDQIRFYATLMLEREQIETSKIKPQPGTSYYANRYSNPITRAIMFNHPAEYIDKTQNGIVKLGRPIYMLVEADDGEIVKPYPMKIEKNDTSESIDGWMLLKTGPEFGFSYNEDGEPVFELTVQAGISCKSDKCLNEMDALTMMKTWYNDDPDLKLTGMTN